MEALAARRELFARVGGLRADVSPADDVDWFARVKDHGHEVAVLPETLLRKRVHAASTAHTSAMPLTRLLRASVERKRGRVAVVVPVRDGERYLEAALRSLLDQTRPPDDIVVVDDGSRDGSAIAEALGVRVLRRPATGVAAARNAGVHATTADLLAFLDADDLAEPRRLELQVAALAPGLDAVIGHSVNFAEQGAERYRFAEGPRPGYNPGSLLIRRAAYEAIGGFDESLPAGEVVDFFAPPPRCACW